MSLWTTFALALLAYAVGHFHGVFEGESKARQEPALPIGAVVIAVIILTVRITIYFTQP